MEFDITDITEEGWKEEVGRLLQENDYLKKEIIANQLMTGLILKYGGPVTIGKEHISNGLPGHEIEIEESRDGSLITFSLRGPDA